MIWEVGNELQNLSPPDAVCILTELGQKGIQI